MNQVIPTNRVTDLQRIARMNRVMEKTLNRKLNMVAEAIRLGYPAFTDSLTCPTAQVEVSEDGRIRYVWNRTFYDSATDNAVLYISLHEACHVVLNHLGRREDRDPELWNISADIAVNEIMDDLLGGGNNPVIDPYSIDCDPLLKDRVKGYKYGIYRDDQAVEKLYVALEQRRKQGNDDGEGEDGDGQDGDGEGQSGSGGEAKDPFKSGCKPFDNHDTWDKPLSPETQMEVNRIVEQIKDEIENDKEKQKNRRGRRGRRAGNVSDNLLVEIEEVTATVKVPWQKLLRNRLCSVRKQNDSENWARVHRKMYDQYPDMLLPGPHEDEKLTSLVAFFCDTSGSMDEGTIAELIGIGKTLPPDEYEVVYYWFDMEVYECTDVTKPIGRGGTSFQCIEDAIKGRRAIWKEGYSYWNTMHNKKSDKKIERYPDIVIVATDGEAMTPDVEHGERWLWILSKDGTEQYINTVGTIYRT